MQGLLWNSALIDRRKFIKFSSYITIFPLLGLELSSCDLFAPSISNWDELSQLGDGQGKLVIDKIEGTAFKDNVSLAVGMQLETGQSLEIKSGYVLASLPDESVIKLSQKASLTVNLDSKRGGLLHLKKGGLLAIVRKSPIKPYLIRNASAVVGIKGTVFYTQVLSEEDRNLSSIPRDATDYFCNCNGTLDFLTDDYQNVKSDRSTYHNSYFLKPKGKTVEIDQAGMLLNHSDEEILDVIDEMKGEKLRTDWISWGKRRGYNEYE